MIIVFEFQISTLKDICFSAICQLNVAPIVWNNTLCGMNSNSATHKHSLCQIINVISTLCFNNYMPWNWYSHVNNCHYVSTILIIQHEQLEYSVLAVGDAVFCIHSNTTGLFKHWWHIMNTNAYNIAENFHQHNNILQSPGIQMTKINFVQYKNGKGLA